MTISVKRYSGKKLQLNLLEGHFFLKKSNKRGVWLLVRKGAPSNIPKINKWGTLLWQWRVHESLSLVTTNDFSLSFKRSFF